MKWLYRSRIGVSILLVVSTIIFVWVSRHFSTRNAQNEIEPWGFNSYQKVTGDSSEEDRGRWDRIFNTETYVYGKEPSRFLREHLDLLPKGRALDIAMGEGRNAVFLAKRGFKVEGVDYSDVALRKASRLAKENQVSIQTINADLTRYSIPKRTYEVIVNIHFHEPTLVDKIKEGLKPGGVVVYETFTKNQLKNSAGMQINRDQLLDSGELRSLFSDFEILVYREVNEDDKSVAQIIARRPE